MKNQYFGDVNDYRKYGLLRTFSRTSGLSIGVCWLLTKDDKRTDGEFRNYLSAPHLWQHYDSELYNRLQRLLQPGVQRSVRYAREWKLIPQATYFEPSLVDKHTDRDAYFKAAWTALHGCDLIFLDPDNGIEVQSTRRATRGSAKYVYWLELQQAFSRGHSLLIYQHFPRKPRKRFVLSLVHRLAEELGALVTPFLTAHVVFFLVQQPRHEAALRAATAEAASAWRGQIDVWAPGAEP